VSNRQFDVVFDREIAVWHAYEHTRCHTAELRDESLLVRDAADMFDGICRCNCETLVIERQARIWLYTKVMDLGKGSAEFGGLANTACCNVAGVG
jgi:hypothetical protein